MAFLSVSDPDWGLFDWEQEADEEQSGLLTLHAMKMVLTRMSDEMLGLSRLQILSIMSACQEDDTGRVDYVRAAPKLAAMIYALIDAQGQEQRIEAINELGKRMEDVGVRK